jgi:hypothetical protein
VPLVFIELRLPAFLRLFSFAMWSRAGHTSRYRHAHLTRFNTHQKPLHNVMDINRDRHDGGL